MGIPRPTTSASIMARPPHQPSAYVTCRHCGKQFGAITVRHLRRIHGYEDDHPIMTYKAEFGLRFAISAGSRKKISEAKESFWEERGQHWTADDVLAEVRRIHEAGGCLRCHQVAVKLYEVGRRLFGTWRAAVEAAGLDYEEASGVRRWDRARVVERIQRLAAAGVPLDATHVKRHYLFLYEAAIKLFPYSWAKALRAAGFDPDEYKMSRGPWDEEQAREWVRGRAAEGRSLLARDVPRDLVGFVHRHLGMGWADFVEALGFPYPGVKKCRDWSEDKLLSEIRRWHAEGHRLNFGAVKSAYSALIHQARRFFGSWDRARAAAGV
jgi:hypothetical protein